VQGSYEPGFDGWEDEKRQPKVWLPFCYLWRELAHALADPDTKET